MRIHPTKLEKAPLNKRYYSDYYSDETQRDNLKQFDEITFIENFVRGSIKNLQIIHDILKNSN